MRFAVGASIFRRYLRHDDIFRQHYVHQLFGVRRVFHQTGAIPDLRQTLQADIANVSPQEKGSSEGDDAEY